MSRKAHVPDLCEDGYVKEDIRDLTSSPPGLVDFVTLYTLQLIVTTEFEMKLCTPSGGNWNFRVIQDRKQLSNFKGFADFY